MYGAHAPWTTFVMSGLCWPSDEMTHMMIVEEVTLKTSSEITKKKIKIQKWNLKKIYIAYNGHHGESIDIFKSESIEGPKKIIESQTKDFTT